MSDWMFYLGSGDDHTSTPKERRNPSATSSASAPGERVLLCGHLYLGNGRCPSTTSFKTSYPRKHKECFPEFNILSMLFSLSFLIDLRSSFHTIWNGAISRQEQHVCLHRPEECNN